MLTLDIPSVEFFDESTNEFVTTKGRTLHLEHSLLSLSKWESKWQIPFLDDSKRLTTEQMLDYIRCMTLDRDVDPMIYKSLSREHLEKINAYVNSKESATWFSKPQTLNRTGRPGKKEIMTSEVIYHSMFSAGIPIECEKWHLNRLFNLIRIFGIKSQKPKKMSKAAIAAQNRALNDARRKKYGTGG